MLKRAENFSDGLRVSKHRATVLLRVLFYPSRFGMPENSHPGPEIAPRVTHEEDERKVRVQGHELLGSGDWVADGLNGD